MRKLQGSVERIAARAVLPWPVEGHLSYSLNSLKGVI